MKHFSFNEAVGCNEKHMLLELFQPALTLSPFYRQGKSLQLTHNDPTSQWNNKKYMFHILNPH